MVQRHIIYLVQIQRLFYDIYQMRLWLEGMHHPGLHDGREIDPYGSQNSRLNRKWYRLESTAELNFSSKKCSCYCPSKGANCILSVIASGM